MQNEFLKNLIKIKSTSDNLPELIKAIKLCKTFIKQNCKKIEIETDTKDSPFLFATNEKEAIKNKRVNFLLVGHLDVVPGEAEQFIPKIKEGKVLGRGAIDMKGSVAGLIEALIELTRKGDQSTGLLLTTDEEIGGKKGVKRFLEMGWRCDLAVIPDGGSDFDLVLQQKGSWLFHLVSKGKSSHSANPWKIKNPINDTILSGSKIIETFPVPDKESWISTVVPTILSGGKAINTIPHTAKVTFNCRFVDEIDRSKIEKKIRSRLLGNTKLETEAIDPSMKVSKENKFIKRWIKIANKSLNKKTKFARTSSASDARHFSQVGIPTIVTRGNGSKPHTDNEWASIKDIEILKNIIVNFILSFNN